VSRFGARSIASLLIFLLCAVLTPVAIVGEWGHRTLTDQTTYLETMLPLATDEEVQLAVADTISDAIIAQVDTESAVVGFLGQILPDSPLADTLAAPFTSGVNALVRELVTRFLQSEAFVDIWTELNIAAQQSFVAVLEGENVGPIKTQDGALVLDISTLLIAVQDRLVERGVGIAANITIEPDKREIVLAEPPGLAQVQFVYQFASPILSFALLFLTIGFAAAILLSRRRSRMTMWVGGALTAWGLLVSYALNTGQDSFVNRLSDTPLGQAADQFWSIFFANLATGLNTITFAGILIIAFGWLAGASRPAHSIRRSINDAAARMQVYLPPGMSGGWSDSTVTLMRIAAIGVAVLVFVLGGGLGVPTLVWSTVLGLVLVFAVQVIGVQPRAAHQESNASLA
jgi:hypothetical protein